MSSKIFETIIYEDLGFPIQLIDVPMRKIFGDWVLDVDLNELQIEVINQIIQQPIPLHAEELRFIRKYLEMTTTAFGEVFGVTHAAVLKWEQGHLPPPSTDLCIRMYVMKRLHVKHAEFGKLFHKISMADLAEAKRKKTAAKPITLRIRKRSRASLSRKTLRANQRSKLSKR